MHIRGCNRNGRAAPWTAGQETECRFIAGLVASALGVPLPDLHAQTRGSAGAAFARQTAMYLAHVEARMSLSEVGRYFGRDRTTVRHACALVEDMRDDPRVERIIECLEAALECWRSARRREAA